MIKNDDNILNFTESKLFRRKQLAEKKSNDELNRFFNSDADVEVINILQHIEDK